VPEAQGVCPHFIRVSKNLKRSSIFQSTSQARADNLAEEASKAKPLEFIESSFIERKSHTIIEKDLQMQSDQLLGRNLDRWIGVQTRGGAHERRIDLSR
jgi:hypothetical protein